MYNEGQKVRIVSWTYPQEKFNMNSRDHYHYYEIGQLCEVMDVIDKRSDGNHEYRVRAIQPTNRNSPTQYVYQHHLAPISEHMTNKDAVMFLSTEY